jgi:hypothetical protein
MVEYFLSGGGGYKEGEVQDADDGRDISRTGRDSLAMDSDRVGDTSTYQPLTPIHVGDGIGAGSIQVAEPVFRFAHPLLCPSSS